MEKSFLGSGMTFPPKIDKGTGRFFVSNGEKSVKESIYLILMTNMGERWLEPDFGSNLLNYTFMDTSLTMLSLFKDEISNLILTNEPRVSDVDIEIDKETRENCLIVTIYYILAENNKTENMVFPFYTQVIKEERDEALL